MIKNDKYGKCPELEKALNDIPGIKLPNMGISFMEAIGNEGGKSVNVWFHIRDQRVLMPLGRCLDRRYGGLDWRLEVTINDMQEDFVGFHLQSKSFGDDAIEESKELAKMLKDFMDNKSVLKHFSLDEVFEEQTILDKKEYRENNLNKVLDDK